MVAIEFKRCCELSVEGGVADMRRTQVLDKLTSGGVPVVVRSLSSFLHEREL
ncbi:hypothetical protein D9M69_714250 [compost metagenome]